MLKILIATYLTVAILGEDTPKAETNDEDYYYNYDDGTTVEDFFIQKECVCSMIGIYNVLDATEDELTVVFANMKHLIGSLSVLYVNYKSLKFLAGLETIETDFMGVNIAFNPKMTEVGLLNLTTVTAPRLLIGSNPNMKTLNIPNLKNLAPNPTVDPIMNVGVLKSPNLCITTEEMERFLNKTGPGNTTIVVKYCDPIPGGNVCTSPQYECTRIFGEVSIGREPEWELKMFETVEYIFGNLQIYEVNLTSFDFLPNLKYIANQDTEKPALYIYGNPELKNFTFPSLRKILSGSDLTVVVSNSSEEVLMDPKVCIGFAKLGTEPSKWGPIIDGQTCAKRAGLYVQGNTELRNTTFFSLKKILSGSLFTTIIANCSEELLSNPAMCIGLTKLEAAPSNWGPVIDGQTCEQIKETARNLTGWVEDNGKSGQSGSLMLIVVVFLVLMNLVYC